MDHGLRANVRSAILIAMFLVSLQSYFGSTLVVTACDTAAMPAGHQKNIPLLVRALLRMVLLETN
jgi:hypothetical protein